MKRSRVGWGGGGGGVEAGKEVSEERDGREGGMKRSGRGRKRKRGGGRGRGRRQRSREYFSEPLLTRVQRAYAVNKFTEQAYKHNAINQNHQTFHPAHFPLPFLQLYTQTYTHTHMHASTHAFMQAHTHMHTKHAHRLALLFGIREVLHCSKKWNHRRGAWSQGDKELTYVQWIAGPHGSEDFLSGLVLRQSNLQAVRVETDWRCGLDGQRHFSRGRQWRDAGVADFHGELFQLIKKKM